MSTSTMYTFIAIFSLICANIAIATASCNYLYDATVTPADISTVVNKHNQLRALIANGQVPGQPRGTNVGNLVWDAALAAAAQNIANTCEFAHVAVNDPRWYVGQNLYKWSSTAYSPGADWNGAVQAWFDEHVNFEYPTTSRGVTGHYTQVVWAKTTHIGCGYTYNYNNGWYDKFYVCNYGPGGNYVGEAPYQTS